MPSAANVKIDKQITPENALVESNTPSPLRQAITVIEHKIRNLEKRKVSTILNLYIHKHARTRILPYLFVPQHNLRFIYSQN